MKWNSRIVIASIAALMTVGMTTAALATGNEVKATQVPEYGEVLTDANGISLYMFTADKNGESSCYDSCATAWPPFVVEGKPQAGTGANANLLGTSKRKDGGTQVTYNGMPLYYFAKDDRAGDTKGEGIGGNWYLVSPAGKEVKGR